jgi:hypothetical protein
MRTLLLSSSLLALSPLASAQESLADRFPSDAVAYFSVDTRRLVDGAVGLDLAKLLDEPQVQQFLAPLADQLPAPISTQGLRQLIDMVPWRQYVDGRVEMALRGVHVDVDGESFDLSPSQPLGARELNRMLGLAAKFGAESSGPHAEGAAQHVIRASFDLVASVDAGDQFGDFFDTALKHAGAHLGGAAPQAEPCRVGGRDATRYTLAFGPQHHAQQVAYVLRDGKRWWFAGSPTTLEHCLDARGQDVLSHSRGFANFRRQVSGGDPAVLAYFDVAKLGHVVEKTIAPIVKEELDLLGVSSMEAIGFASSFVEGGVRDSLAFTFSEKPHGFLGLLDAGKGGFDLIRRAPSSTGMYLGARLDAATLLDRFVAVCRDVFPGTETALERGLTEANAHLGMDVRHDLLAAFGDEVGLYLTRPTQGSMIPDGMAMLKVRDRAAFEKLLTRALDAAGQHGQVQAKETTAFGEGCRGWTLTIANAPVQPAIALTNDLFCVSSNVLALKRSLHDLQSATPPASVVDNATLKRVLTGLTGSPTTDGLSLLAFVDLTAAVEAGYPFVPNLGGELVKATGGKLDMSTLPETETVTRHFSGIGVGGRCDEHGMLLSFFTPAGIGPGALLGLHGLQQHLAQRGAMVATESTPRAATHRERPAAAAKKPVESAKPGETRSLAEVFAALEKATGASIEYPDDLGGVEVAFTSRSGDLQTNLAELAKVGGFQFSIRDVDGEKHVVVTKG